MVVFFIGKTTRQNQKIFFCLLRPETCSVPGKKRIVCLRHTRENLLYTWNPPLDYWAFFANIRCSFLWQYRCSLKTSTTFRPLPESDNLPTRKPILPWLL